MPQPCAELARGVIAGQLRSTGFKRMCCNHKFYTAATTGKQPEKSIIMIRTEHLWDDLKDLDIMLGGKGSFGACLVVLKGPRFTWK